jgi:hypothetical protein
MNLSVIGLPKARMKVEKIIRHKIMSCQKPEYGLPLHNPQDPQDQQNPLVKRLLKYLKNPSMVKDKMWHISC